MIEKYIGNSTGNIYIKDEDGKYFLAVACNFIPAEEWGWTEISKNLYNEILILETDPSWNEPCPDEIVEAAKGEGIDAAIEITKTQFTMFSGALDANGKRLIDKLQALKGEQK